MFGATGHGLAKGLTGAYTAAVALGLLTGANGQNPPDYGFDWVTIGAPGNRATTPDETPYWPDKSTGAVAYEFRVTRTEVTNEQWFEFVNAYAPFWEGHPNDPALTGVHIYWDGTKHVLPAGTEKYPTVMSWRVAARFCNWLGNGKSTDAAAFETGAYDTSTFGELPNGVFTDQATRSPGATFWIPSMDEWDKAAYYDPNRYGEGQGGYWLYPDGGNEPLVSGLPKDGGETNAGENVTVWDMDVGQYSHVQSPWGLLDASGGVEEWTERIHAFGTTRMLGGSAIGEPFFHVYDRIDEDTRDVPFGFSGGLRLAGSVPAVSTALLVGGGMLHLLLSRQRRERDGTPRLGHHVCSCCDDHE